MKQARRVQAAEQLRIARAGHVASDTPSMERLEIRDVRGEVLMSFPVTQLFDLIHQLTEVGLALTSEQHIVEGMISVPAVTAADLAGAFEMGRQAGERTAAPTHA